jgi:hypothetical protein
MPQNPSSQAVVPPARLAVDARERAALALTEAVTRLSQDPVPGQVY